MALTIVQQSQEVDGMQKMTAVREDVLQIILAKKERVTVSMTQIVSTLAGPNVAMICALTPSISQQLSTQITQTGLVSVPMTIAATGIVTKTTTDVAMVSLDVNTMRIVMMDITVTLT